MNCYLNQKKNLCRLFFSTGNSYILLCSSMSSCELELGSSGLLGSSEVESSSQGTEVELTSIKASGTGVWLT